MALCDKDFSESALDISKTFYNFDLILHKLLDVSI